MPHRALCSPPCTHLQAVVNFQLQYTPAPAPAPTPARGASPPAPAPAPGASPPAPTPAPGASPPASPAALSPGLLPSPASPSSFRSPGPAWHPLPGMAADASLDLAQHLDTTSGRPGQVELRWQLHPNHHHHSRSGGARGSEAGAGGAGVEEGPRSYVLRVSGAGLYVCCRWFRAGCFRVVLAGWPAGQLHGGSAIPPGRSLVLRCASSISSRTRCGTRRMSRDHVVKCHVPCPCACAAPITRRAVLCTTLQASIIHVTAGMRGDPVVAQLLAGTCYTCTSPMLANIRCKTIHYSCLALTRVPVDGLMHGQLP